MDKVEISIVLPLYNKEKYIDDVLNAIKIQTFKDFEVVVVDDGSTDDSARIVEGYANENIHLIRKKNGGVSSARNVGVQNSSGHFIFFLDGDDIIDPQALDILYNLYLSHSDCEIFTGNFEQVYPNIPKKKYCRGKRESVIIDNYKDFYHQKFYLRTGICLIKREVLLRTEGFNENLSKGEDLEFFFRLMSFCKIAYTPKVVFNYVKEASELSKEITPLEKNVSSVINLDNKGVYERKVLSNIVILGMLSMIKTKDYKKLYSQLLRFKGSWMLLIFETPHSLYSVIRNSCIIERLFKRLL